MKRSTVQSGMVSASQPRPLQPPPAILCHHCKLLTTADLATNGLCESCTMLLIEKILEYESQTRKVESPDETADNQLRDQVIAALNAQRARNDKIINALDTTVAVIDAVAVVVVVWAMMWTIAQCVMFLRAKLW